jgi:hypothetical protein
MKLSRVLLRSALLFETLLLGTAAVSVASAQEDPLQRANEKLKKATDNEVFCTFEERTRWEQKFGVNFGKSVDQQDILSRLRVGCGIAPTSWLTVYAMGQDARVPFYGPLAPNTMRDPMALAGGVCKAIRPNRKRIWRNVWAVHAGLWRVARHRNAAVEQCLANLRPGPDVLPPSQGAV